MTFSDTGYKFLHLFLNILQFAYLVSLYQFPNLLSFLVCDLFYFIFNILLKFFLTNICFQLHVSLSLQLFIYIKTFIYHMLPYILHQLPDFDVMKTLNTHFQIAMLKMLPLDSAPQIIKLEILLCHLLTTEEQQKNVDIVTMGLPLCLTFSVALLFCSYAILMRNRASL